MNYCNCVKNDPEKVTAKFRIVETCEEGICLNCGHYTLIAPQKNKCNNKRKSANIKYSDAVISDVLNMLQSGIKGTVISKKTGVSPWMISKIKNNKVKRLLM